MNTVRLPLLMSWAKQVFGYGMGKPVAGGVGGGEAGVGEGRAGLAARRFRGYLVVVGINVVGHWTLRAVGSDHTHN